MLTRGYLQRCRATLSTPGTLPSCTVFAGGELILTVFEKRLPDSIEKQPFKKILEVRDARSAPPARRTRARPTL